MVKVYKSSEFWGELFNLFKVGIVVNPYIIA